MPHRPHEVLQERFLQKAEQIYGRPTRVLSSTTYKIGKAHVLVRVASEANSSRRYFFGLKYAALEELVNLKHPIVALVCGDIEKTVMIPAADIFANREHISTNQVGDYRMTVDNDLNLTLKGRGNRLDCQRYINQWDFFGNPPRVQNQDIAPAASTSEESMHAVLQGRLIEIGNMREFSTYCPDRTKTFNNRKLSEISTLQECPELQFSDYKMLSKIDVLWFQKRGNNYLPKCGFEVELSTGVWPGVMRLRTLLDYNDVKMYVVSDNKNRYQQAIGTMPEHHDRYVYLPNDSLSELYSAEKGLVTLRKGIGL